MEQKKQITNEITEGVIWRQLLLFFFPIVLGTFFQQLYNTVDTVIVGQFVGTKALASVGGSAAQIANLIVGFFTGLSSGASVIVAQFFGAKDKPSVQKSLHTAYAFSILGSILFTIPGILLAPSLLSWMNTPVELMADSTLYLRIYFAGTFFSFIYNMGSSILRATGDAKRPLYYLIISCFLNIILDTAFVLLFHLDVFGVAFATYLAQAFSAFLVTYHLMRSNGMLKLSLRQIRLHKDILRMQLRIGLPTGFQSVMYNITNIIVLTALNGFGTMTTAAWSVYGKLDPIFWMICSAFGISITTFVGQNYGAGKLDRVRKSTRICLGMSVAVSCGMSILLISARNPLFSLFTNDSDVITLGAQMLAQLAPWYTLYIFVEILSGALRGLGDVFIPTVLTLFGVCFLRILWVIGAIRLQPTITAIIYGYPVTWGITAISFIIYYLYRIRRVQASFYAS